MSQHHTPNGRAEVSDVARVGQEVALADCKADNKAASCSQLQGQISDAARIGWGGSRDGEEGG